jgi:hypothetical protein
MIALHRPVAASAPLVDSYYIFRDGRGKIKKQRPRETFFDFFSFSKKSRPPASARYVEYPELPVFIDFGTKNQDTNYLFRSFVERRPTKWKTYKTTRIIET